MNLPAALDVVRADNARAAQLEHEPPRHARQRRCLPQTQVAISHGATVTGGRHPARHPNVTASSSAAARS
jgi:hypothetical protein